MAALIRTSKYFVHDVTNTGGSQVKSEAQKHAQQTGVAVGGGRKVLVTDVAKVAILGYSIGLDGPTLEKMDAELQSKKGVPPKFKPSFASLANPTQAIYPSAFARAAVFARIVSLMQARSAVRSEVIEFLVDMLETNMVPNFSCAAMAGTELVAVISGSGFTCHYEDEIVSSSAALKAAGLTPLQLTIDEANTLMKGQFWSTGCTCLVTAGAFNIITMVDCVAALSCDAFGVSSDAFDGVYYESRPHRGQMASASNLRLLLEGSKRVNAAAVENTLTDASMMTIGTAAISSIQSFCSIPQVHGPAQEMITSAIKALEIELNSCEPGPISLQQQGGYDPTQSLLILRAMTSVLAVLWTSSQHRRIANDHLMPNTTTTHVGVDISDALPSNGLNDEYRVAYYLLNKLATSLDAELVSCCAFLSTLEGSSGPSDESSTITGKTAGGGEGDDDDEKDKKSGKPSNMKPEVDDSSMTPEQRAKAEAKRKLKAEKAAQKLAAKEAKKGASGGGKALVLGVGSMAIRREANQFLQQSRGTGGNDPNGGIIAGFQYINWYDPTENQYHRLLIQPFDMSEDMGSGFSGFCTKLLEQLNSGGEKRRPKIAKGTRDYGPEQMRIREQVFAAIKRIFKRHGGVEIDTPVFELKEVLTGKYGEDSKLIYDLADQGGELLSLRYDLTVPFARFLAMNSVGNIKRYHIAKVYRRDQPQLNRGRYREFYQCDFDVAGSYSPMVPDAEVITVCAEILSELPVGNFIIKLNHRRLLDAIFDICGVPIEKFRPICSAVDKLDKASWEEVKTEMVSEKGLSPEVADRIGVFVLQSGPPQTLWSTLTESKAFGDHEGANGAMVELYTLFEYLNAMGSLARVSFDLSLARGLDYYTGVIYEAVLIDGVAQVGSIAAGGRYDNLVGMFSPSSVQTPCVGVSIGVERVFTIIEKKAEEKKVMQAATIQVFIASIGAGLVPERMKIAHQLWKANISSEYSHQDNPKFKKQLDDALERGIPFMVVFGSDELKKGVIQLKNMQEHTESEIPIDTLVTQLLSQGCRAVPAGADMTFLDSLHN